MLVTIPFHRPSSVKQASPTRPASVKILALETSAQPGEIAVMHDERIVHETSLPENQRTTQSFVKAILTGLHQANWTPQEIDLFAVCEGPGSFTGLRIGLTAAKTFGYATGAEVIAVPTLEVLADQVDRESTSQVWATLNAQRQQLFVAEFRLDHGERPVQTCSPQIVDARAWLTELPTGTTVTGSGICGYEQFIPAGVIITPTACWKLQARHLAALARQRAIANEHQDLWKLVPRYYRQSAAEEKLQSRESEPPN